MSIEKDIHGFPLSDDDATLRAVYGKPGEENLTRVILPYPLYFDGMTCKSAQVHKLVAVNFVNAFQEIFDTFGRDGISKLKLDRYGGSYNLRPERGGVEWSTHAYGIAFDLYPEENQLKWGAGRAAFAKPEYSKVIEIFEKHGFYNKGKYKGFDYMHFQAAKPTR